MNRLLLSIVVTGLAVFSSGRCTLAAELETSGPEAVSQALTSWYDQKIPSAFKIAEPLVVREMSQSELIDYINSGSGKYSSRKEVVSHSDDIDGVYDSNPPRIGVRIEGNGKVDNFTFAHEYGHYVWFDLMKKADRKSYEAVYNKSRDAGRLVTDYASVGVDEGFAEAFSFYVNLPQDLKYRDPESFAYLDNWAKCRS
jgi:hypothetical protein